jgi:hypothetical protein
MELAKTKNGIIKGLSGISFLRQRGQEGNGFSRHCLQKSRVAQKSQTASGQLAVMPALH